IAKWWAQYEAIRGRPYSAPSPRNRTYLGVLPSAALPQFARAMVEPSHGLPLGPYFDRTLWLTAPPPRPVDPVCASLLDLAESEFRARRFEASGAVARIAHSQAPDELGPQLLLANASQWLIEEPSGDRRADFHVARAKAYRLLDNTIVAQNELQAALTINP